LNVKSQTATLWQFVLKV